MLQPRSFFGGAFPDGEEDFERYCPDDNDGKGLNADNFPENRQDLGCFGPRLGQESSKRAYLAPPFFIRFLMAILAVFGKARQVAQSPAVGELFPGDISIGLSSSSRL